MKNSSNQKMGAFEFFYIQMRLKIIFMPKEVQCLSIHYFVLMFLLCFQ